jgi:hypothetical protein
MFDDALRGKLFSSEQAESDLPAWYNHYNTSVMQTNNALRRDTSWPNKNSLTTFTQDSTIRTW